MTNRIRSYDTGRDDRLPTDVRWDLIRQVRRQIARGEYETDAKWRIAIGRLLEQLER